MRITEIYSSVQGETQYAGLPCTLVRTTGCDLRCTYCDSAFAFYGGRDMTLDEIVTEVGKLGAPLVLLTGGEPMLQKELPALATLLLERSYRVMIETSGAHALDGLPAEVVRIVDVNAVKFVLTSEADYQWATEVIRSRRLADKTEVLLSPAHGRLAPEELVSWMLRDKLPARLNLQIHKYIWSPEARGV